LKIYSRSKKYLRHSIENNLRIEYLKKIDQSAWAMMCQTDPDLLKVWIVF